MTDQKDGTIVPTGTNPQVQVNNQFIGSIRDSISFDVNWDPAIAVLPMAIANLAKANMYGSLPDAAAITFDRIDTDLFPKYVHCLLSVIYIYSH